MISNCAEVEKKPNPQLDLNLGGRQHFILMNILHRLNYKIGLEGVCFGFILKWLEAALIHEEALFFERYKTISELVVSKRLDGFLDFIHHHKKASAQKARMKKKLKDKELQVIDIFAFLDGIATHMTPNKHSDFLGKTYSQNQWIKSLPLTTSNKIEQQGGLINVYNYSLLGDKIAITCYLNQIQHRLQSIYQTHPDKCCVLTLHGPEHVVGLRYQPSTNRWIFVDANLSTKKKYETERLVAKLASVFENHDVMDLTINIITTKQHQTIFNPVFSKFREQQFLLLAKNKVEIKKQLALRTNKNNSLLSITAKNGDIRTFKLLFNVKVFPEINHDQLMLRALDCGHVDIVEEIIKLNPKTLEQRRSDGTLPIHQAAMLGYLDIFSLIYAKKPELVHQLAHQGKSFRNCAHLAADEGRVNIIEFLLNAKPFLFDARDESNLLPIHHAGKNNHVAILKLIHTRFPHQVNAKIQNMTFSGFMAQEGRWLVIRYLHQINPDCLSEEADMHSNTVALIAAFKGKTKAFKEAIKLNPAVVTQKNAANGTTCSHIAAILGHKKIVKFLIKKNLFSNERHPTGKTPLDLAIAAGHKDVAQLIRKDINDFKFS